MRGASRDKIRQAQRGTIQQLRQIKNEAEFYGLNELEKKAKNLTFRKIHQNRKKSSQKHKVAKTIKTATMIRLLFSNEKMKKIAS